MTERGRIRIRTAICAPSQVSRHNEKRSHTMSRTSALYRILSFEHLVDLFESRTLHFSSPRNWEDPFEKILVHRRSAAMFAQCWCKKAVSDAMWRIYSDNRMSVRIKTHVIQLSAQLHHARGTEEAINFCTHDVEYLATNELSSRLKSIAQDLDSNFTSYRAADALLVKRTAFDHEAEVRVVVHDNKWREGDSEKSHLRVAIDPHALIESIYFDPRASDRYIEVCTFFLRQRLKFKGAVGKSGLYRTQPELLVE